MTDTPSREYITVRMERSVYDSLCRLRLAFANDIDSGRTYTPDPGGAFPSLSWVIGRLCTVEAVRREIFDRSEPSARRAGKGRKGKVPCDNA